MAKQATSAKLSIRMLGELELRAGEQKSVIPAGSKIGLLLAHLSLFLPKEGHPAAGINTDELAALIWPELNREGRLNNFRVNFHTLKSELVRDLHLDRDLVNALFLRGRLTIKMNPALVVTDVAEFLQAREDAEQAETAEDRHRLLRRANRLYKTGFLPEFTDKWSRHQRRQLSEQHLEVLEQLLSLQSGMNDPGGTEEARIRLGRCRTQFHEEFSRAERQQGDAPLGPLFGYGDEQIAHLHRTLHGHDSVRAADPAAPMPPRMLVLTGPGGVGKTRLAQEVSATLRAWSGYLEHHVSLAGLTDADDILEAVVRGLALPCRSASDSQLLEDYVKRRQVMLLLDDLDPQAGLSLLLFLLQGIKMEPGARLALIATTPRPLRLPEAVHGQSAHHPVQPLPVPQESGDRAVKRLREIASVQLFIHCALEADSGFQLTVANAPAVADLCRLTAGVPGAVRIVASRASQYPLTELRTLVSGHTPPQDEEGGTPSGGTAEIARRATEAARAFSYGLLPPPVQRLFRLLPVFRGGCTAAAARAVCSEPLAEEYLEALARYQMIRERVAATGVRYALTGEAKTFAGEKKGDGIPDGDTQRQIEGRHDDFFLGFAREVRQKSRGPNQSKEMDRLAAERDNLDAVLKRCLPQGMLLDRERAGRGLRLAVCLWEFWNQKGLWRYGRTWLERAVRQTNGFGPPDDRAVAFNALAVIAAEQGDLDEARVWAETSVGIATELIAGAAEPRTVGRRAEALNTCGYVVRRQAEKAQGERDFAGAREYVEAARAFYGRAADDYTAAWGKMSVFWPWNGLGQLALLEYELLQQQAAASGPSEPDHNDRLREALDRASDWLERCFTVALKTSDQGSLAQASRSLADVLFEQGQQGAHGKYGGVWVYLSKCLAIWQEIGDWGSMAVCAERLAKLAAVDDDWNKAMHLCGMAWGMRLKAGITGAADSAEDGYFLGMKESLSTVITLSGAAAASSISEDALRRIFKDGVSAIMRDGSSARLAAKLVLNAEAW